MINLDKVNAKGEKRLQSYCLNCHILKAGNGDGGRFHHRPTLLGSLAAESVPTKTTELLTVTDNYYKAENNGSPSASFLLFLLFLLFGH